MGKNCMKWALKMIIFRCDASLLIGSGHVMRCRTLARKLVSKGKEVCFVCRQQEGDLIGILEREFKVLKLQELRQVNSGSLESRGQYLAWLGCEQTDDAKEVISLLKVIGHKSIKLVVVDHYGIDYEWEHMVLEGLGNTYTKLVAIDDLADRRHESDILIDQNFYSEDSKNRYMDLVPKKCERLMGTEYALLGQEYGIMHSLVPYRKDMHRIMIFMGGIDKENLTTRILNSLINPKLKDITIDVILGHNSQQEAIIRKLAKRRPHTYIHRGLSSLAGLMVRADLAIGACGATTWERMSVKLPTISFVVAENQEKLGRELEKKMGAPWMNASKNMSELEIYSLVEKLRNSPNLLEEQSKKAGEICDGLGTYRVYAKIKELIG